MIFLPWPIYRSSCSQPILVLTSTLSCLRLLALSQLNSRLLPQEGYIPHRGNEGTDKGLTSRQAHWKCQDAWNRRGRKPKDQRGRGMQNRTKRGSLARRGDARNLKFSLRGSVEWASSTWAGSVWTGRLGLDRLKKPGARYTKRQLDKIFRKRIYLGFSDRLIYEYSITGGTCVRACIKVLSKHIRCTDRIILNVVFFVLVSLYLPRTLCFLRFPLNLHFVLCCYPDESVVSMSFRT